MRNLAAVSSRALNGIESPAVSVEVHVSNGLPSLSIVGLPEASVKESKDRVRSALLSSGFELPPKRITVNLAPADLPKSGGRYDLPIAIGLLMATGQLEAVDIADYELFGELALDGGLRGVKGALPSVMAAMDNQKRCLLPEENLSEAALTLVTGQAPGFYVAHDLITVCRVLMGERVPQPELTPPVLNDDTLIGPDVSEVSGQVQAKRVLEVCASGHHSLIMVGPPGSGKSMLAARLPGLFPCMTAQEAIQAAAIQSVSGQVIESNAFYKRPFISPHHTASTASMVGGGSHPKPGAISLAHKGILFLDELPEFNRPVLEALREPLETKQVNISRVNQQVSFPADCLLIAAMNPSPSGFFPDDPLGRCKDTPDQIYRYQRKISGPLLDRIDLHLEVPPVELTDLQAKGVKGESSTLVRARVMRARARQYNRQGCLNSQLTPAQLEVVVTLDELSNRILEKAINQLGVSARGYHRILRVARTLADMEGAGDVSSQHIAEALGYRSLDRMK